ncbi:hypothetical protein, partial [Neisseria gonorrhoeae]|uniref:hypothetical protein n=1 Tax=Neisseria gonorrhoeae TaxID=485 RepID=UPI0027D97225
SSALETFKQQRNAAEAHYLKANRVSVFFREYTAAVETLLAALRCCLKVSSAEDRFSGIFILSIGGKKGGGWFGGQIPLSDG